jgi:sarcosine oxidase gamma subunit
LAELSLSCPDFSLAIDQGISIAALRYFESATVAGLVRELSGCGVPGTGQALGPPLSNSAAEEWILAWRSPTETLVLSTDSAALVTLEARLADASDACFVDQTGGIWVLRLTGARVHDVLLRLGPTTAIPGVGQALTSRLAELTVTAVCVQEGEILLLVDRLYADHLLGWIRETIADF